MIIRKTIYKLFSVFKTKPFEVSEFYELHDKVHLAGRVGQMQFSLFVQ